MSRIVILVGSARRGGNTELLAGAFADGARENGNDVEIISAADIDVHPCIGCNTCFAREGHGCFQNDGMTAVYEKLKTADTLVIASPVYFYGVSAQLKAVIDRLHTPMRNSFGIKRLGLILVGAAELPDLFDPILLQYKMVLRFFGLDDIGSVLVRGAREKGDVLGGDGMRQAYELGKDLKARH